MQLNRATFRGGEPLSTDEQSFLDQWISQSEDNKYKYERYSREEWLDIGLITHPETTFIMNIEDLIFTIFLKDYDVAVHHQYRYFLLIARYVVVGISVEELHELTAWAARSSLNQRVLDQFTTEAYAKQTQKLIKKFTSEQLYVWYMNRYHPLRPARTTIINRLFKK